MSIDWKGYRPGRFFDELIAAPGKPRPAAAKLIAYLDGLSAAELRERRLAAELAIKVMGISFTVYAEGQTLDRAWPFDIIPRIIPADEWARTEAGLKQRVRALNLFIGDLYGGQKILKDRVVPRQLIAKSENFRAECAGVKPAHGVWAHVCGTDLVRDADGTMYVLEDNLRVPSGVSYMIENRMVTKRVLPELFEHVEILPVDDYPTQLYDTLCALSPRDVARPVIALLTPGIYNSAYFEHAWLAQQMGVELIHGEDLTVEDDIVYMRTVDGLERVDVIYRRVDDLFLDPTLFNPDSALGAPGLVRAWIKGNVGLANAPGAGVADDKAVYAYLPKIIKYYLGEDPILPNVPTFLCHRKKEREHVLANLKKLVVKPANQSGGYGMLVGPKSTAAQRRQMAAQIRADPRNFIAQPTLALSTTPTFVEDGGVEPRHVDLRPFILSAKHQYVTTGGLTRAAFVKGSLVVNSSQGGGAKDTWIVDLGASG